MFHCKKTTAPFRKIIPCRFVVWVCVVGICIWAYPSSTWIDLEHVKQLPCFFLSRNLISYGYFKTSHRSCFGTNESRSNYGNMSSQILRDSIFKDSTTAEHFRTHAVNFDFRSLESVSGYIKWTTFFPTKKGLKLSEFEVFRQKKKQLPRRSQALSSCQSPLPCWERATSRATAHIKSRLRQKQLAMDGSKHITEMLSTRQIQRENGRMIIGNMG